jgi:hypothetical protein
VFCLQGGTFKEISLWVKKQGFGPVRVFRSDFCSFLTILSFRIPSDFDSLVDLRPGFGFNCLIPLLHFVSFSPVSFSGTRFMGF